MKKFCENKDIPFEVATNFKNVIHPLIKENALIMEKVLLNKDDGTWVPIKHKL